jgi:hypothetical protein
MQRNKEAVDERYKRTLPVVKVNKLIQDLESRLDLILTTHLHHSMQSIEHFDAHYIFESCWQFLLKDTISMSLFPYFKNSFQLNYKEFMLLFLIRKLHQSNINYVPSVGLVQQDSLLDIANSKGSAFILSVHNGFAFSGKVVSDLGLKGATISSDPLILNTFDRSGIKRDNDVNVIKDDKYCLAHLRGSISNGEIICCNVDYAGPDGKCVYVSPALFECAVKFNVPLYFAKSTVSEDGTVSVGLKRSDYKYSVADFMSFINSSPDVFRVMTARAYRRI